MDKSETKYYNTSLKMYNALFKLLEEKDFSLINIKELCNEAGINRSTFYSHFDNMNDLLNESKEYVMKKFFNNFEKSDIVMDIPIESSNEYIINEFINPYLIFIKNNKILFKVFVDNLKTFDVDNYYNQLLKYVFIPSLKRKGLDDTQKINYITRFYLTGITSIIMEWIKNDCNDNIEYISDVILSCNKYSIF